MSPLPSTELQEPPPTLRIACLEPSATAICVKLGLQDYIVGVTHECPTSSHNAYTRVLTANGLSVSNQGAIHAAVTASAEARTCSLSKNQPLSEVPSLYPLLKEELQAAAPTLIFTQNLCGVCAPTEQDVQEVLLSSQQSDSGGSLTKIISLQPHTLQEVSETFVTIAEACGVKARGERLQREWMQGLERIQAAIEANRSSSRNPSLLLLEWLDPPFDGGHWTYQMMEYACVSNAMGKKTHAKSKEQSWEKLEECNPDVVVVGCCGFELDRNVQDVKEHAGRFCSHLPQASRSQGVFACNGNMYIAQPGPDLLQGTVVLAKCAYRDQPRVLEALDALGFLTNDETALQQVDVIAAKEKQAADFDSPRAQVEPSVLDMEDLMGGPSGAVANGEGFAQVHAAAIQNGQKTYVDPETGYQVFTSLAHEERGWCCGSGCRHCPFNHKNVKDKATKSQQPSLLYRSKDNTFFSPTKHSKLKVLFFSGGKDSFLTIRALVKQYQAVQDPFGLVLLTTFDATSRMIAHQEVQIDDVMRQAEHLDITLLGIPLRRSSGESYLERIERGLSALQGAFDGKEVTSLVFGDLHLAHIKDWRDKTFGDQPYALEYPLWKTPYSELLRDLEASKVPCMISGSTKKEDIEVGLPFDRSLYNYAIERGLDGFGENGEFHSLAKVWEVSREVALGTVVS